MTSEDLLLEGFSAIVRGDRRAGVALLGRGIEALAADKLAPDEDLRWLGLGSFAAGELFDDGAVHALASRWVRRCRDQGALTTLPSQ